MTLTEPVNGHSKVADLQRRYAGRISAAAQGIEASESATAVTELMQEWNPIYAAAADVRAIMGVPSSEFEGILEYAFDSGLAGILWRFTISNGAVVGVEWEPLN